MDSKKKYKKDLSYKFFFPKRNIKKILATIFFLFIINSPIVSSLKNYSQSVNLSLRSEDRLENALDLLCGSIKIKTIFPESAVQIDGFHVMQTLNNGIRRDFKYYRAKHYRDEINELLGLRSYLNVLQENRKHAGLLTPENIPPLKKINPSHSFFILLFFY